MREDELQRFGTTTPLRGMRRTAARRLTEAWEAPAFHVSREIGMEAVTTGRSGLDGVTVTDVLLWACAATLQEHPHVNAHFADGSVTTYERVNLGFAAATDKGLTVPVIRDAASLGLPELAERRNELARRARRGRLGLDDLQHGTFTLSNLGMFEVDRFDAILNPPQVAILAVAATRQRYVMHESGARWTSVAELTLTCDHRALDGVQAAMFLEALAVRLSSFGEGGVAA